MRETLERDTERDTERKKESKERRDRERMWAAAVTCPTWP